MGRDQIYHEVELGVVIGKTGVSISESQAMDHVGGYTLALDMTDLDLIREKVSKQNRNDTYVILCDGLLVFPFSRGVEILLINSCHRHWRNGCLTDQMKTFTNNFLVSLATSEVRYYIYLTVLHH